jgi:hypothetical protein
MTVDPAMNVADLKAEAKRELGMTEPSVQIVAHMATAVANDVSMKVIAIDEKPLEVGYKVSDLKISDGRNIHIVFKLRDSPAAATGGAGTSSGEWRTPRACAVAQRLGCVRVAHLTLRRPSAAVCVCRPGGGSDRRRGDLYQHLPCSSPAPPPCRHRRGRCQGHISTHSGRCCASSSLGRQRRERFYGSASRALQRTRIEAAQAWPVLRCGCHVLLPAG